MWKNNLERIKDIRQTLYQVKSVMELRKNIYYIGVDDKDIDLFESQYIVPNGISYNSYVIMDEKIAVMDSVDDRKTEEWLANLEAVLGERKPDYIVVSHMEPDHSGSLKAFHEKYPEAVLVMHPKAVAMYHQFFQTDIAECTRTVNENDTLSLGEHELTFIFAPMVHWPEVMVTYESSEKILFSADGFGKFGALDTEEDWACEARRYYFNIVGKYGAQVQMLLKKAAALDIQMICPLHGPILSENLGYYIDKYNTWSSYTPEDEGILIAVASIHGNTRKAAEKMAEILTSKGAAKVVVSDLSREDMAEVVEDAFRYDKMILACATYDGGLFTPMETFLSILKSKNYQKRKIGLIENGTWAPMAARLMKAKLEEMKALEIVEDTVAISSAMDTNSIQAIEQLADMMLAEDDN